jgi:uncharacterized protein (TIGR00290 family)
MTVQRVWCSWSSGKDSAYALAQISNQPSIKVTGLLTTISEHNQSVTMHHVPEHLVAAQAEQLALPWIKVSLPLPCPNEVYEDRMTQVLEQAKRDEVHSIVFGDLFLQDIRSYREERLATVGMDAVFPLWEKPTRQLAEEMIGFGQRAMITCVDTTKLPASWLGRTIDHEFLKELPEWVDPCGENGEFHTFVYASPLFRETIPVTVLGQSEQGGFASLQLR